MDSATIDDLKQFIGAELSQQTSVLEERLEQKLEEKLTQKLEETKNEILDALGETMGVRNEIVDNQIADIDTRVTRLERRAV